MTDTDIYLFLLTSVLLFTTMAWHNVFMH